MSQVAANYSPAKPIRFMQVHHFYHMYLDDFILKTNNFANLPFDKQLEAILADGFAGSHMFAPYLKQFGYDSKLIIGNARVMQERWLKERGLAFPQGDDWMFEVVKLQIEEFKPEVLYLSCPTDFDSSFVRRLNWQPKLILGWRAARIPELCDLTKFDLMLSHLSDCRERALRHGAAESQHFFPGFPTQFATAVKDEEKKFDVTFFGQWTEEHSERNKYILDLARAVINKRIDCKLALFIPRHSGKALPEEIERFCYGAVWALDMHRVVKQSRICINAEIDLAGREAGNMRLFEVTGTGSFLLTQNHPNLKNYFVPGKDLETFETSEEMIEKIDYYLKNPVEREAIAKNGQNHCLTDYNMDKRAALFNMIVRDKLAQLEYKNNSDNSSESASHVIQLMQQSIELFDKAEYIKALDQTIQAKRVRFPVPDLDYLRALIFVKLNRHLEAREALKEELRYFPDNKKAQELLNNIPERPWNDLFNQQEFGEIFKTIRPYTMVDPERAYTLYQFAKMICENDLPGNFVECGVAAGGTTAILATVIKRYSKRPRRLFSCDTFSGMPTPTEHDIHEGQDAESTGWGSGTCSAPEESALNLCRRLGSESVVTPVKGLFEETLPVWKKEFGEIALLHLDGDWYSSTLAILDNLYDQVAAHGIMQADDYGYWDGCKKALHEFESKRGIKFDLKKIDAYGVFFQKS